MWYLRCGLLSQMWIVDLVGFSGICEGWGTGNIRVGSMVLVVVLIGLPVAGLRSCPIEVGPVLRLRCGSLISDVDCGLGETLSSLVSAPVTGMRCRQRCVCSLMEDSQPSPGDWHCMFADEPQTHHYIEDCV